MLQMIEEWTRIKNAGHEACQKSVACWWSAAVDDIQDQECWEGYRPRKIKENRKQEILSDGRTSNCKSAL